jgi:hypothetical protein
VRNTLPILRDVSGKSVAVFILLSRDLRDPAVMGLNLHLEAF